MRWLGILLVVGCDGVFGLTAVQPDAPGPDAALGCSAQPTALFCANFDDGPMVYENGMPVPLPMAGRGVMAMPRTPAKSAPYALWVDSPAATDYGIDFSPSGPTVTRLDAGFALQIGHFDATSGNPTLVEIGMKTAAGDCYAAVELDPSSNTRLITEGKCPADTQITIVQMLPISSTWIDIHLTIDVATSTVTTVVNNSASTTYSYSIAGLAGTPHVAVGTLFNKSGSGNTDVGLDDILVTTR